MQKFKGLACRVSSKLILVSFIGLATLGHSRPRCLEALLPDAEIYLSKSGTSVHLKSAETSVHSSQLSDRDVLLSSPLSQLYQDVLKKIVDPKLKELYVSTLSSLEERNAHLRVGNYESWLRSLLKCNQAALNHRLYEALHAMHVATTFEVKVTLEPQTGFFHEHETNQTRKSMDLRIDDPESGRTLSYKEVKKVQSLRGTVGAVDSIVGKARFIRPRVGDEVELSAIVFIDTTPDHISGEEQTLEYLDFAQVADSIENRLARKEDHSVDSLTLVDLKLGYYIKLYFNLNGVPFRHQGNYNL